MKVVKFLLFMWSILYLTDILKVMGEDSRLEPIPTSLELMKLKYPQAPEEEKVNRIDQSQCYSSMQDVSHKPLIGRWTNRTNPFPGIFTRHSKLEEWWLNACPVQMIPFSCSFRDATEFKGHGYDAAHRYYEVENCILQTFIPSKFFSLMKNRNLHFCCDSSSMQIFAMIACSLHGYTETDYSNVFWRDFSHTFVPNQCIDSTGIHCHLGNSAIYYPEFNFRLTYCGSHLQPFNGRDQETMNDYRYHFPNTNPLGTRDILILNHGIHHHNPEQFQLFLEGLIQQYQQIPSSQRFLLIWRETWAQHFDTTELIDLPIGYFHSRNPKPCASFMSNVTEARQTDYRNHIANTIMTKYQIPILRIYNASMDTHDQNVGKQSRRDEVGLFDCTHYCDNAGILYFIRDLIMNILPPLLPKISSHFLIKDD